jgi:ABC-2 type transport system permease protein
MLIQFIIFPVMAFVMTEFVAKSTPEIPSSMFVTMFAAMFIGMTPLSMTAGVIAEDKEHNSLRFLVMAGVKPHEYLIGTCGFTFLACALVSLLFGLIGGFTSVELAKFVAVLILGSCASLLLGATIGLFSKNQQAATAISTPTFMLLAFSPMIAQFNTNVAKVSTIFYTQQVNTIVNNLTDGIMKPILIILANIAILLTLFIIVYRKNKIRGKR